jgi:hypothetical protein
MVEQGGLTMISEAWICVVEVKKHLLSEEQVLLFCKVCTTALIGLSIHYAPPALRKMPGSQSWVLS